MLSRVPAGWRARIDGVRRLAARASFEVAQQEAAGCYADALSQGQRTAAAQLALDMGLALNETPETAAAVDWLEEARSLCRDEGDGAGELVATALLAMRLAFVPDQVSAAIEHLARCIEMTAGIPLTPLQRHLVNHGLSCACQGLGLTEAALRIAREQCAVDLQVYGPDSPRFALDRVNQINLLRYRVDESAPLDPEASRRYLQEAVDLVAAVRAGWSALEPEHQLYALTLCGLVLSRAGRAGEAEPLLRQALADPLAARSDYAHTARVELAVLLHEAGRLEEAHALASQARAGLRRGAAGLDGLEDWQWHALARLARVHGDWREAHDCQQLLAAHLRRSAAVLLDVRLSSLARRLSETSLRLQNDDLREINRDLSRQASTDGLTGVLNRRALEEQFAAMQAHGLPMVLLMIDVDRFKAVNDRFSHVVGDEVLRQVARLLDGVHRETDRVGRYGGEEFALLLPLDHDEAVPALAERLRARVQGHDWSRLAQGLAVTVSGGWVRVRPQEPFAAAVARADTHLYAAKRAGRNRMRGA